MERERERERERENDDRHKDMTKSIRHNRETKTVKDGRREVDRVNLENKGKDNDGENTG